MKHRPAGRARLAFFILVAPTVLATVLVGAGSAGTAFHGKNGKIAYVRNITGGAKIWSMNANGTGRKLLTRKSGCKGNNCTELDDAQPAWSPKGTKIAFARSNAAGNVHIFVMNANGSGRTQLTHTRGARVYETSPAWSPDGKKIAFTSQGKYVSDIYVINANDSGRVRLTNMQSSADAAGSPAWSPDGTKIAFDSGGTVVDVMNADGSDLKGLTAWNNNYLAGATPSWSPDGTRIVYTNPDRKNREVLWVMNADGSGKKQLTVSGPPRNAHYEPAQFGQPSWSPDGTKIVFYRMERPKSIDVMQLSSISVMNPDGSGQKVLRRDYGEQPDWGTRH
jgi:Tol biopolymer transport system component